MHDPTEPDLPTTSPIKKGDPFDVGFYTTSSLTTGVAIHSNTNRWEQDKRGQFTGITVKDEGTNEGTEDTITSLNFTGDGVSVTRADNSDEVNVAVTGGSGGSSETAEQIKSKLETLSGPDRLAGSAVKDAQFISQETTPTDLTPYVNGQVLRVQPPPTDDNPDPEGEWLEIRGADAGKLHSFGADFVADPANPAENTLIIGSQLSYGVSFTTSRFGNLYTADRGKPYTASNAPVRSMIIELTVTRLPSTGVPLAFSSSLTCTIPKSDLASAPNSIWGRYYDGPPGSGDEVDTVEMVKSADNPAHTYHTYTEKTGSSVTAVITDILSIKYFNLFTASPQTSDQTSNPLELHSPKATVEIDPPAAEWARVGQPRPIGAVPSQRFTVQRTQRNITVGNYRLIDKSSDISNIPIIGGLYGKAELEDGSIFYGAISVPTLSQTSTNTIKFYRIANNSDNTDYALHEVTPDTGVTIPTDFPLSGYLMRETHDHKVLVIGGRTDTSNRNHNNHSMFVLSVNPTTNKITNIRKLNSTINVASDAQLNSISAESLSLFKNTSGDFFILYYANLTGARDEHHYNFYKLVIAEQSDTLISLISVGSNASGFTNSTLGTPNSYQRGVIADMIEKTNHSYAFLFMINTQGRSVYIGIKVKNSDLTTTNGTFGRYTDTNQNVFTSYLLNTNSRFLDGTTFVGGYRYEKIDVTLTDEDGDQDTFRNEFIGTITRTLLATLPQYRDDRPTPTLRNYGQYAYTDNSTGDIKVILTRSVFGGDTNYDGIKITAEIVFPVTGDIQTVISRRLLDSATFDTANAVFIRDELKSLTGDNKLSVNDLKDDNFRRVSTLPAESSSSEGEWVYVPADYTASNGVNITPQSFAGTELDPATDSDAAAGIGSRGWYAKADAGFTFGEIHPPLPDDFVLISDQRVYVKRNTQTNLSKLHLGTTEYTLTRTAQAAGTKLNSNPAYASHLPDVDYYTISGGLPDEDWDDLRFETTTAGTFIPAGATITKGLYEFKNNDWSRAGFYAPPLDPSKPFKIAVEEDRPGTRADKNLAFVASGSTFTNTSPFPHVLRLTYNNGSTDTGTYQRWTIFVDLEGGQPSKTPSRLKIGSVYYSFSYFETDAGQAVYRTPVVATAQRVASARTVNAMNVQWDDGEWAGQTGETSVLKTINKETLESLSNALKAVHSPPFNPKLGQRIEMLNDLSISGGAVMTAKHGTGGPFIGYAKASIVTAGAYGTLVPDNENFVGLQSFANQASAGMRQIPLPLLQRPVIQQILLA